MPNQEQSTVSVSDTGLRAEIIGLVFMFVATMMTVAVPSAQAQTFTVLHTFTGADGEFPTDHLTLDNAGNIYGTASEGGSNDGGTAFKMSKKNGSWIFSLLHNFYQHPADADAPRAVLLAPDGSLLGSSRSGGGELLGTLFGLRPPATFCASSSCPWGESFIYRFQGGSDGCDPGDIVFDHAGNVFGTTSDGPCHGWGSIYELMPSGGSWTKTLLYTFSGQDGAYLAPAPLAMGTAGNMYGTTNFTSGSGNSYYGYGTVYQLTPSGSGLIQTTLYTFPGGTGGAYPQGVILGPSGDLFGVSAAGGSDNSGIVFELVPGSGSWAFNVLYNFRGTSECGPLAPLTMDRAGNLYGVTFCDGAHGYGNVFKLTPAGDSWTYSSLHDFTGGSDGAGPFGGVILDANDNIYGTAAEGGAFRAGTVWKITQ